MEHPDIPEAKNRLVSELDAPQAEEMDSFGEVLAELLTERGYTVRGFAERVGRSHTFIRCLITGTSTPSLEDVTTWATFLGLEDARRERFLTLGQSARAKGSSPDAAKYITRIERELELLRPTARVLLATIRSLIAICEQEGLEIPRHVYKTVKDVDETLSSSK